MDVTDGLTESSGPSSPQATAPSTGLKIRLVLTKPTPVTPDEAPEPPSQLNGVQVEQHDSTMMMEEQVAATLCHTSANETDQDCNNKQPSFETVTNPVI